MKLRQPAAMPQHAHDTTGAAHAPSAVIAEDEPLIAEALKRELAAAWPALNIVAMVGNGRDAIERIATLQPDVAFLDISMPGSTGLDVARACAALAAPPQIVFVTAYDEYALEAFDAAAIDYLLKPVDSTRLARTIERLRARLARPRAGGTHETRETHETQLHADLQRVLGQLETITRTVHRESPAENGERNAPLRYLRASSGSEVRMVPVDEVLFLEAADKYVVVTTRTGELLIRTSLKELCVQLDPGRFWQVHRSTVVNMDQVESASVNALGKMTLKLRGHAGALAVSKQYAHLFRQM
jgi:DNA-binding LytR/AlgR family response regulator